MAIGKLIGIVKSLRWKSTIRSQASKPVMQGYEEGSTTKC